MKRCACALSFALAVLVQPAYPLLARVGEILTLGATSPAIDTAAGVYAFVTDDLDGQARGRAKDVGADEYSTAAVVRRPLTLADVGPDAP